MKVCIKRLKKAGQMKNKCDGCGALVQFKDREKPGYIKSEVYYSNPDNFLCERCYNLVHYNKNKKIVLNESEFKSNLNEIGQSNGLVVLVIDIVDIIGSFNLDHFKYFKSNDIILVFNKYDLIANYTSVGRIKTYLRNYLRNKDLKFKDLAIISKNNKYDIERLINLILKYKHERDIYFVGVSNVGKSSIINKIIEHYNINENNITVSNKLGTTLDFIKIPLLDKTYLFDTPGIINKKQATYYLTSEDDINIVIPNNILKPRIYQINRDTALMFGRFGYLKFINFKGSVVFYINNLLPIHKTNILKADDLYNKGSFDLLKVPNETSDHEYGKLKEIFFEIYGEKDISVSGLGFIKIKGEGKIKLLLKETIDYEERDVMI